MLTSSSVAQAIWQNFCLPGATRGSTGAAAPAVNAIDLPAIVDDLVPRLQRAGKFRTGYRDGETLRERLGLASAPNRYAAVSP